MTNLNGLVTGVVMVLVFVGGFALGNYTANLDASVGGQLQTTRTTGNTDAQSVAEQTDGEVSANETTIDTSLMTEGQRQLLESLGVDADSISITPQMIACTESSLGEERVLAIQNGDTPSFFEGTKLMTCYTAG